MDAAWLPALALCSSSASDSHFTEDQQVEAGCLRRLTSTFVVAADSQMSAKWFLFFSSLLTYPSGWNPSSSPIHITQSWKYRIFIVSLVLIYFSLSTFSVWLGGGGGGKPTYPYTVLFMASNLLFSLILSCNGLTCKYLGDNDVHF